MEKFTHYEQAFEAEEFDQVPLERRNLLTEDASEYVVKVNALKMLALREVLSEEMIEDPKFIGCLELFLTWLQKHPAEELKHSQTTNKQVTDRSELAGMTVARELLALIIDMFGLDLNKKPQVLELLRSELARKSHFSEDDVAVLIQGINVCMGLKRKYLNSFSDINSV